MKNISLKILVFTFIVGLFSACGDEYLTEVNPNEIAKDSYWRNLDETGAGLNATYHTLHDRFILGVVEDAIRTDQGWPGYGRPAPNNINEYYNQTFTNSSEAIIERWQANYKGIFRANQVIEALENIQGEYGEDLEWTSQMAQAKFLRGLFHYYLYTVYNNGSVILREKNPLTDEEINKAVSPAEEVLAFIKTDMEYAYDNLYKKGEYPNSNDLNRATSGAAATILGSIYLNEFDYTTAMTYFEDVIDNHGYQLVYDMDRLFTTEGEHNEESIFEVTFSSDLKPEENVWSGEAVSTTLGQIFTNTVGPTIPAWMVWRFKTEQMDPLDNRNYYDDPSTGKTLRNVPLRASAMAAIVEDNQTEYYLTGTVTENGKFHGTAWGYGWWKKYSNHDIVEAESALPYGAVRSGKNVTMNRLADVMLMQAECKIKTGDLDAAIELMNKIRQRWGLVLLGESGSDTVHTYNEETYTASELMEHLMNEEKALEMCVEGYATRYIDFKRWEQSEGIGLEQRFAELSNEVYYGVPYKYVNSAGVTKTKWNFPSIVIDPSGAIGGSSIIVDYEYDTPAANYSEKLNGTFPLPLSEVSSNPNIN
ncbi:Starch-binding associating with outer membrane [Lutibacter oricola]|uniref:Starch-binding associating with outer membrane n=1 Tax=Lutibacter oricola TaxID=762486 RepID=A0A1H3BLU6_9FLAO|nr:RagB/SusD family nutrient uptake outer membrane protein [Lutibacter oricola]SDX42906.1 Starch-binding associating with outer membrane [Lutibacter oricola]